MDSLVLVFRPPLGLVLSRKSFRTKPAQSKVEAEMAFSKCTPFTNPVASLAVAIEPRNKCPGCSVVWLGLCFSLAMPPGAYFNERNVFFKKGRAHLGPKSSSSSKMPLT
jgi:hypothetical protein